MSTIDLNKILCNLQRFLGHLAPGWSHFKVVTGYMVCKRLKRENTFALSLKYRLKTFIGLSGLKQKFARRLGSFYLSANPLSMVFFA